MSEEKETAVEEPKKKPAKKKKAAPSLLDFAGYQKKKGADPMFLNGYSRAAQAKQLDVSGKRTEAEWDALFRALC
tara:strand:+ start:1006 stop:1230 length:225 start_codon:yes stop_codon:yes gene_type:complete